MHGSNSAPVRRMGKVVAGCWRACRTTMLAVLLLPVAATASFDCVQRYREQAPLQSPRFSEQLLVQLQMSEAQAQDWRERWTATLCGDVQARLELTSRLGSGGDGLLALVALIDAGERSPAQLPQAIAAAGLSPAGSATLLRTAYGWMLAVGVRLSVTEAVAHTEWAIGSADPQLAQAGWELRAVFQHPPAVTRRAELLFACADAAANSKPEQAEASCLAYDERMTASTAILRRYFDAASPKARRWLTLWVDRSEPSQRFLLERLPEQTASVQQAILEEALGPLGANPALAIQGALLVLEQALDTPQRRPPAVPIDFSADHGEGVFGWRTYGDDYPFALAAAFDELATYPDASRLMQALAALEHPWLATHAAMWLIGHDQYQAGWHGLRFALEADGLPPATVLRRLVPGVAAAGVLDARRQVFLAVLEDGALGKWNAVANQDFAVLLSDPQIAGRALRRMQAIPARAEALAGVAWQQTSGEAQALLLPELVEEIQAVEWAIRTLNKVDPEKVDHCIDAFAAHRGELWKVIAFGIATETGRVRQARKLAAELADSNWDAVAERARAVLGSR